MFGNPQLINRMRVVVTLRCLPAAALIVLSGLESLSIKASAQASTVRRTARQRYAWHDSVAASARKAGDWAGYKKQVVVLDSILNGHPNIRVVYARINAHLGDTAAAYQSLRRFAAMGLVRAIAADPDLEALRGTPSWTDVESRIKRNAAPTGKMAKAFAMPDSDFVAEDISYDPRGQQFLVSGIRRSGIMSVSRSGAISTFAPPVAAGWGTLAVAVDSVRNILWASTEALSLAVGYDSANKGRSAILEYDLTSGALRRRYDLPADSPHSTGDIAVARNGDLFIADAVSGELHVIRQGKEIEKLVSPGEFWSPQGPAMDTDGKHFYLADYGRGIARVTQSTGEIQWLKHPADVAINGIDGLTMAGPSTLIAVQNGTNPNRILKIMLDKSGTEIKSARVIVQDTMIQEPTHGVFIGRDYYFIANGGYGAFGDDGNLAKDARPVAPVVMKIANLR